MLKGIDKLHQILVLPAKVRVPYLLHNQADLIAQQEASGKFSLLRSRCTQTAASLELSTVLRAVQAAVEGRFRRLILIRTKRRTRCPKHEITGPTTPSTRSKTGKRKSSTATLGKATPSGLLRGLQPKRRKGVTIYTGEQLIQALQSGARTKIVKKPLRKSAKKSGKRSRAATSRTRRGSKKPSVA